MRATDSVTNGRFQVLTLDGGGPRAIFGAAALEQLEADFETRIIDHFDLIAGTSTGGLIALRNCRPTGSTPMSLKDRMGN